MFMQFYQYTLEKPDGSIKNGQSRDNDNIGVTRHRTKTNTIKNQITNTKNTNKQKKKRKKQTNKQKQQKTKMMNNKDAPKTADEPMCSLRESTSLK